MIPEQDGGFSAATAAGIATLARRWLPAARVVRHLAEGGFSGGAVWLVEAAGGRWVLKSFPPSASPERARFVHRQMREARAGGAAVVPTVLASTAGDTVVAASGAIWEMVAFVDGIATDRPDSVQVAAALAAVAGIHATAEAGEQFGEAAAVARRVAAARRMLGQPWATLGGEVSHRGPSPLQTVVQERLALALAMMARGGRSAWLDAVAGLGAMSLRQQWVVRDVWSEHVLFAIDEPARVAGIIDYHASGLDTPATDLGRLLGSWLEAAAVEPAWWNARLAAYEAVRPLRAEERRLVPWLAATGVVFGIDNWFRWTLEQGRQFGSTSRVTVRLDRLLESLPIALEMLQTWASPPGLTAEKCSS